MQLIASCLQALWFPAVFRRNQVALVLAGGPDYTCVTRCHVLDLLSLASRSEGVYNFPSPFWDAISDDAKDLVKQLLKVDPAERMTVDDALAHPFLQVPLALLGHGMISTAHPLGRTLRSEPALRRLNSAPWIGGCKLATPRRKAA